MDLHPHAPAGSLILLAVMALFALVRVRAVIKRHGERPLARASTMEPAATRSAPSWWVRHLEDYAPEVVPKSAASDALEAVVLPEPVTATKPSPAVSVSPAPAVARKRTQMAPGPRDYTMSGAVELWFGEVRVSVRPGSNTERRFVRFATLLLDDVREARQRR